MQKDFTKMSNQDLLNENQKVANRIEDIKREMLVLLDEMEECEKTHLKIMEAYDKRFNNK